MSNDENKNSLIAALEALLFVYGEPIEYKRLADILEINESDLSSLVERLAAGYESGSRGLSLVRHGTKIQLVTKPSLARFMSRLVEGEFQEDLTPAATETLSLILYGGPLSRAQIEYVRGVNSSFILRSLLLRGLIERSPDPRRQNVYLYAASFNILKKLGLDSVDKLPDYNKYRSAVEQFLARQEERRDAAQPQNGKSNDQI